MIMIKYLNDRNKKYLTMSADNLKVFKWYAEESFAVQLYFKIHIGLIMNMG